MSQLIARLLTVAALVIGAGSAFAPALAAAQPDLVGPLRLRDLTPFALQRLDFLPASADAQYPRGWALEANASYTNTFIMSGNVHEYLEGRDERSPLGEEDFAALSAMADDAFYFDGSITVLNLAFHYGISERFAVYGIVPVHHYHGGSLDSVIESFHEQAGFDDFGRPLVGRDLFQGFFKIGKHETVLSAAPRRTGVADPVIGLRRRRLMLGDWDVVLEAAVKLPWGVNDPLFSSGSADVGGQVSLQRQWGNHGLYLNWSHVYFGGSDSFGGEVRRHIPGFTAAWEARLGSGYSTILQLSAARSLFRGDTDPELAANQYQVSFGLRKVSGNLHYTAALTENILNFNNTPDIGFHFGIGLAY